MKKQADEQAAIQQEADQQNLKYQLIELRAELDAAQAKLMDIKKFHLLRSDQEKNSKYLIKQGN